MHAFLMGATGVTGKDLQEVLLKDNAIHRADSFVRRNLNVQHDKLKIQVVDF